ncbi:hypothetical protein EDC44_1496 [Cricetibacter osteomyelitidis]|uniref:Uncharacterized protein n=1 Tax=Cricetibacter osteomyelitidis TaxID=1521931 RepID=A0A4R2SLJ6_9PAST|nr:hypothetical protein [Cricetibacter osteomyelitidis]TCP88794.1 hypothetical protein EDC44_1496 [Cricetibacter osteomyelitidis]
MTEKQYSPDMVARNVKQLGNGVIEVRRYTDGHIRADLSWVWFLAIIALSINNYFFSDSRKYHIDVLISTFNELLCPTDPMPSIDREFLFLQDPDNIGYILGGLSYKEFVEYKLSKRRNDFYWDLFINILLPLFWFYMVISPRWRAVRFDSKRRLVYFWDWGRLYILRYPLSAKRNQGILNYYLQPEMFTPWIRQKPHGALVIHLPHENQAKAKKRRLLLGIYRPACPYQNQALLEFIQDYLSCYNPDEEFAHYFKKEKRISSDYFNWFYQFSLFPQRGYNEKKTEAKIQAWLEKYGDEQ